MISPVDLSSRACPGDIFIRQGDQRQVGRVFVLFILSLSGNSFHRNRARADQADPSKHAAAQAASAVYAQRVQALLLAQPLPNVVNLGELKLSPDGRFVNQDGFMCMTEEQLQQLARQLQAQPSVTHLNLYGNRIGPEGMRLLAEPIAMQTGLKTLLLYGTCILC